MTKSPAALPATALAFASDLARRLWRLLPISAPARGRFAARLFAAAPFLFGWSAPFRAWKAERPGRAAPAAWSLGAAVRAWNAEARRQRAIRRANALADKEDGVLEDFPSHVAVIPDDGPVPLRWRGTLGVHLGLAGPERRQAIFRTLDRLPSSFDLFISAPQDASSVEIEAYFAPLTNVRAVAVEAAPARGGGLGALLKFFGEKIVNYDVVVHLHTQKRPFNANKQRWPNPQLHHLLHSRGHAARLLNLFADDPDLGLVFPASRPQTADWTGREASREAARVFAARLGSSLAEELPVPFPTGGFFMARGGALKPLLILDPSRDLDADGAAGDALVSALERLPPIAAGAAGFSTLEVRSEKRASLSTAYRDGGGRYWSGAFETTPSGPIRMPTFRPGLQDAPRIAIFTCATGGYDQPLPYETFVENADYVFFTDVPPREAGFWTIAPLSLDAGDPVKTARFHKTQPHAVLKDCDIAIWIDGNISVVGDITPYIRRMAEAGASFGRIVHPWRSTTKEEVGLINAVELEDPEIMRAELAAQAREGYADQDGLTETNFLIMDLRRAETRAALDLWRRQIETFSRRDQLSFDFARWKAGASAVALFEDGGSVRSNACFAYFAHGGWMHPYRHRLADIVRGPVQRSGAPLRPAPSAVAADDIRARAAAALVDVIVCVHNSPEDVANCLASLERIRDARTRLILVDDGSAPETAALLRDHAQAHADDVLIRHEAAQGYTRAANAGLRRTDRDYAVLLNSDTIVSDGWLDALVWCGESDASVGLVGPLSNAASWQSTPSIVGPDGDFAVNTLAEGWTVDDMARLCARLSDGAGVSAPVLNGFCLAIKRAVIDKIGVLDEVLFPQGYGEETDYCFRAVDAGFSCLIATGAYVYHSKSKSFTHERRRILSRTGFEAVVARHSRERVARAVDFMKTHHRLTALRTEVAARLGAPPPEAPRLDAAPALRKEDIALAQSDRRSA